MQNIHIQIAALLTAMTISAVIILLSAAHGIERDKSAAAEKNASTASQEEYGFVLGAYEGRLALFREDHDSPYRILETELYLLPEDDRRQIESGGILVATEEELEQLLEDWDE